MVSKIYSLDNLLQRILIFRNSKEEKAASEDQQVCVQNVGIVLHSDVYR